PFFVNQFTYGGRVKRVYVQADAKYRMSLDAFNHLYTPTKATTANSNGITTATSSGSGSSAAGGVGSTTSSSSTNTAENSSVYLTQVDPSAANTTIAPYNMVPLSSVVKAKWGIGPLVLPRYNGYSAIEIVGASAEGYSTGQAIDTLQNIVDTKLPNGFAAD